MFVVLMSPNQCLAPTSSLPQDLCFLLHSHRIRSFSLLLTPQRPGESSKGLDAAALLSSVRHVSASAFVNNVRCLSLVIKLIGFVLSLARSSGSWLQAADAHNQQWVTLPTCRLCKVSICLRFFTSSQTESSPSLVRCPTLLGENPLRGRNHP